MGVGAMGLGAMGGCVGGNGEFFLKTILLAVPLLYEDDKDCTVKLKSLDKTDRIHIVRKSCRKHF
jgi:hypothetical protein